MIAMLRPFLLGVSLLLLLHAALGFSNFPHSVAFSRQRERSAVVAANRRNGAVPQGGSHAVRIVTTTSRSVRSTPSHLSAIFGTIELGDLFYDDASMAFNAWEWTSNMGAPAALIGGAVLVTLSETREALSPRKHDKKWLRLAKLSMRYLLLSSFALEVVCIFVGTITGSVLLGHGPQAAAKMAGYQSPLQLLHHHHELEYLTTQICFLQGLFNWLGAVAIEMILPRPTETRSARRMNKCLAGWLMSFMIWMLAFYNNHLSFYSDYMSMLQRFVTLFVKDYFMGKPWRPLSLLYGPAFAASSILTWRAFSSPPEDDEDVTVGENAHED